MKENQNLKTFTMDRLENIHIYGRTGSQKMPLPLFWTGSGVELLVTGTELWMEVETDYDMYEPWISIEINGAWIGRQMITAREKGDLYFPQYGQGGCKKSKDLQGCTGDV